MMRPQRTRMTLEEAREIGRVKLKLSGAAMDGALDVAREIGARGEDLPPLMLALAFLRASGVKADDPAFQAELRDALSLVGKAEVEWRTERALERGSTRRGYVQ